MRFSKAKYQKAPVPEGVARISVPDRIDRFRRIHWLELAHALFLVAFVVWATAWLLGTSTYFASFLGGKTTRLYVRVACYALLFVKEVVYGRWDKKALIGGAALGAMGVSISFCGSMYVLIDSLFFLFSARDVPFRKIAIAGCAVFFAVTAATVLCSLIGVLPNYVASTDDGRGDRYYLGFVWPTVGPALYFSAVSAYVVIRDKSFSILEGIVLLAITVAFYYATNCRAGLLLTTAVIVCAFAVKFLPERIVGSKPLQVIAICSISVIAVVSIALTVFYDPNVAWMNKADGLLSGRLALGNWATSTYGFGLFGQAVEFKRMSSYSLISNEWFTNEDAHPIDNLYVHALVRLGLLYLVVGLVLSTLAMIRAVRLRQWFIVVVVVCVALYGVFEKLPFYPYYNVFLFLISGLFGSADAKEGSLRFGRGRPGHYKE